MKSKECNCSYAKIVELEKEIKRLKETLEDMTSNYFDASEKLGNCKNLAEQMMNNFKDPY